MMKIITGLSQDLNCRFDIFENGMICERPCLCTLSERFFGGSLLSLEFQTIAAELFLQLTGQTPALWALESLTRHFWQPGLGS